MTFTVAIVGRPNVGKSTLFNSLAKKKSAIVYDCPGVTRDRKEENIDFLGLQLKLIDTAGFESQKKEILLKDISEQIDFAVSEADILLFLLDAKSGILPDDHNFIKYIRKKNKEIILVVNKSESKQKSMLSDDILRLGFKRIVYLSAEHRIGFQELFLEINDCYTQYQSLYGDIQNANELHNNNKSIKIAIVGKPNVGKSTFINKLLGTNRLITANESGTTRDAIEISWEYKNNNITLIDTAGIRKRSKIQQKLEKLSYEDSLKAIRFTQICILLFDATQKKLEKQDLSIIEHIVNEGRGLIIILNKSDLLSDKQLQEIK